jgi:O-antigen/teichoic acid export membrane protein
VLVLGLLANTHDVGIYRVADAVASVAAVGQSILATAATPMFASLHASGDRAGLQRVLGVTALGMFISTLALGLPFLVAGHWLFTTVFGVKYAPSLAPFLVIWVGMLIFAGFGASQTYANMTGSQNLTTMSFAITVCIGTVTMLIATPILGPVGTSIGTMASSAISSAWLWRQIRLRDGVNTSLFAPGTLAMMAPGKLLALVRHQA